MKILSFTRNANPNCLGGIETFQRNLYKMFEEKILFLTFKMNRRKYFNIKNIIEIDTSENKIIKFLKNIFGRHRIHFYIIKNILKKEKIDVSILNFPRDIKFFYKLGCKKVLVQHMSLEFYQNSVLKKQDKILEMMRKYIDCFVFLSKYDQEKFVKELSLDINKTKVIRHCCEIELLKEKKQRNKKLIIIARLDNKQKRIDLAIKAMKKLSDFTLEIYGDGPDKEMLNNLIKQEKLENSVFLKGATNKVKEKLDECSIFIMTSEFESYGITNIEAMRRGLPIVLRNTFDAAPDIVQNNGVLLDKEWNEDKFVEAVKKIYDNYEFYSKNAIEMGKRHNFEIIKSQWEELIAELSN